MTTHDCINTDGVHNKSEPPSVSASVYSHEYLKENPFSEKVSANSDSTHHNFSVFHQGTEYIQPNPVFQPGQIPQSHQMSHIHQISQAHAAVQPQQMPTHYQIPPTYPMHQTIMHQPPLLYKNSYQVSKNGPRYGAVKKFKNHWGNLSYAHLITAAILSSASGKMKLNDIYSWFTTNIPYFNERKDEIKSKGWKNSIRHNLSLKQEFKRESEDKKAGYWFVDKNLLFERLKCENRHNTDPIYIKDMEDFEQFIKHRFDSLQSGFASDVTNLTENYVKENTAFLSSSDDIRPCSIPYSCSSDDVMYVTGDGPESPTKPVNPFLVYSSNPNLNGAFQRSESEGDFPKDMGTSDSSSPLESSLLYNPEASVLPLKNDSPQISPNWMHPKTPTPFEGVNSNNINGYPQENMFNFQNACNYFETNQVYQYIHANYPIQSQRDNQSSLIFPSNLPSFNNTSSTVHHNDIMSRSANERLRKSPSHKTAPSQAMVENRLKSSLTSNYEPLCNHYNFPSPIRSSKDTLIIN